MRRKEQQQYILTIIFTLILLVGMVSYNISTFYTNSVHDMLSVGQSSLERESGLLNAYLTKGMDVLQVTAITIEYMMQQGASSEDIERFLLEESERYKKEIDINFTGIYGFFNGEYIDGIGWIPDKGYVPQEREWYITAQKAKGSPAIVSPYLDAKTNTVMISVSQMLYDNESVISLDIAMDEIQIITQEIHLNGIGYGFVIDREGLVIAHSNEKEKGKNYLETDQTDTLMQQVYKRQTGSFQSIIDGRKCTVFTEKVMDDWYVIMIVSDTKLYQEVRAILFRNGIICLTVFCLIVLFCTLSFRKIHLHMRNAEESKKRAENLNVTIMRTLARTIDAKDRYTNGHSQRVAKYAKMLAQRMGKEQSECDNIYYAGLLHDVGKIHIPDAIINKPSRLTEDEFTQMKMHPVSGYYILRDVKENPLILQGTKWHHERYDGKGYPNGLSGTNIPETARIIGVADAYDAMTSNRSYRKIMPQAKVREEIANGKGVQFDPEIAECMLKMIDEDTEYTMKQQTEAKYEILAIDSEETHLAIIEDALKDEPQYFLIKQTDSIRALEFLEKHPVELILLDIQMPELDGFEMYQKIRKITDAPILFMTRDKNIKTITKANEIGVADYLIKPIVPNALREILFCILREDLE